MILPQLHQIQLGSRLRTYTPISIHDAGSPSFLKEQKLHEAILLRLCPEPLWHNGSYTAGCPRPILIGRHHQQQLEDLHEALTIALIDIVKRWWTDLEARFPERMPLEKEEEQLLKWLETQVMCGNLREFSDCLGSWRPDFLVEEHTNSQGDTIPENFRITEINARFSFNGFVHEAHGQQALNDMGVVENGLVGATDPAKILGGLFSLFQPNFPLHLLKGEEHGIDIHMFIDAVWRRFGIRPRMITPGDLRLLPDHYSKSGYRLCCIVKNKNDTNHLPMSATLYTKDGELVEEVHQVGLELHQRELAAMEPEMLRQVSLRCFNDMRTVLLVHDKRMLGIVRQELKLMVVRQVLTQAQATILERGLAETVLPGSQELHDIIQASKRSTDFKNGYILKPIRSGKGAGIVFGDDFTDKEWVSALERLQSPEITSGGTHVIQRRIFPRLYNMILKPSGEMINYPLVGTYHVAGGNLLGLGTWRANSGRIVAVSGGGSWICSVMQQD